MKQLLAIFILLFSCTAVSAQIPPAQFSPKFKAVPFTAVHFDDQFWSPRLKTNAEVSIPHNYEWCEKTGRISNFARAAKLEEGPFKGIYFDDSDVYKLLEGTAYSLANNRDAALEKRADDVINWISKAQQPDGYLNTYFTLVEPEKRWISVGRHELYCAGHLIEAAVAYKRATGKDTLLNVAEKFVKHITDIFIDKKSAKFDVPGHEEIELALVKLYELTGKKEYLKLSEHFIDIRGDQTKRKDKIHGPYQQDHEPLRSASEITGHAVRAVYLYSGAADVAAYTGDKQLIEAMNRLWSDVVDRKMYITGGIGARHQGEAFGNAYELPNRTAYCETCAAIGLVFWAHRMNLLHGDAKYADVVERAMFNGVLAGIGMDGKSFFYVNPLESVGNHHRQPFFDCACCPTNVVRFVPSLPGYQYAVEGNTIYVNQFVSGTATLQLPDGEVTITQKTNYPWDGIVNFKFDRKPKSGVSGTFNVKLRSPQWLGQVIYSPIIHVNWVRTAEETISSDFPMEPTRMIANPKVVANRGRVAIQRGPLVYCFEQCDNEVPVLQIKLPRNPVFTEEFKDIGLPGGQKVVVLKCKNIDGKELTAIPYFAWDHRKPGAMAVWVRQQGLSKKNPPSTGDALYAVLADKMLTADEEDEIEPTVTASFCHPGDTPDAVIDGLEPKNSNDHSIPRMTFWNRKGTKEWLELDFGKTQKVSKSSIYWFDDAARNGGCRIPKSWTLSYRDGSDWKVLKTVDAPKKDAYDVIEFDAVETTGLRIDIQLQTGFSGGVLEWKTE
ncbi:MAG: glycoside hydrolase family 127 protein [Planctomycetaceae bacterium]|nr:glycoside hydrolase family 127 protein [Planctomycetaceae bacterium]